MPLEHELMHLLHEPEIPLFISIINDEIRNLFKFKDNTTEVYSALVEPNSVENTAGSPTCI